MRDLKKLARENGKSLPWIAEKKFGISRQGLYHKIRHDLFTDEDRELLASELGLKSVRELYEEPVLEGAPA